MSLAKKKNKVLAIIPARAGSKGVPHKNFLKLGDKTLLERAIDAAVHCGVIDDVLVSSDDERAQKIAAVKNVHFVERDRTLANDIATNNAVVFDILKSGYEQDYTYVVLLQCTSPFRTSKHIEEAFFLLKEKKAQAVISVCECEHSPLWANVLPSDSSMNNFLKPEVVSGQRQQLPRYYRPNGAIFISSVPAFIEAQTFYLNDKIYAYKMSRRDSIDIDEMDDFLYAQFLLSLEKTPCDVIKDVK